MSEEKDTKIKRKRPEFEEERKEAWRLKQSCISARMESAMQMRFDSRFRCLSFKNSEFIFHVAKGVQVNTAPLWARAMRGKFIDQVD